MNMEQPRLVLDRYSLGVGDRFAHQGRAQLSACIQAAELGVAVIPVWNKSNREHMIVGTQPASARREADEAVNALDWKAQYFVDADHINLGTFERFVESSDFFTLDVADAIGQPADSAVIGTRTSSDQNPSPTCAPTSTSDDQSMFRPSFRSALDR